MKKLLLILISLFVSFEVKPKEINFDEFIARNGVIYKKFTNVPYSGNVFGKQKGKLKRGIRKGEWLTFHDNGQLKYKRNFKNGKLEGESINYDKKGRVIRRVNYKEGKYHGEILFYDENKLKRKINFKNGMKEGESSHYINGQLYFKQNYKNDKLNGEALYYSREDGTLSSRMNYKNGKMEGEQIFYYESGSYYKTYIKKGEVIDSDYYDEDGKIQKEFNEIIDKFLKQKVIDGSIVVDEIFK